MDQSASDLPEAASLRSLPPVDEVKPTGKVWNGYVCPGCRSIFRVAAEFHGSDVICPSCHETLRLPKTPDERQPLTTAPLAIPSKPTRPPRETRSATPSAQPHQDAEASSKREMIAAPSGRVKVALAILVPLAVVVLLVLFQPWAKNTSSDLAAVDSRDAEPANVSLDQPSPVRPPPPPVAVNKMPAPAAPQTQVAETQATTDAALAVAERPPAVPQPLPKIVQGTPQQPEQSTASPDPAPTPADSTPAIPMPITGAVEHEELVEAVPADTKPVPSVKPEPAPAITAAVTPLPNPEPKPKPTPVSPSTQLPAPQVTPAPSAPSTSPVHTVVRGDTLSKIALSYQVDINEIKKANGIRGDVIRLGQQLKIPGGTAPIAKSASAPAVAPASSPAPAKTTPPVAASPRTHTVVRGDTLERIAKKYRVDPRAIMQANGMKNDIVQLGRKLVIPAP